MNPFEAAALELEYLDPEYQAARAELINDDGTMGWLKERFPELRKTKVITEPMLDALIAKLEDELGISAEEHDALWAEVRNRHRFN